MKYWGLSELPFKHKTMNRTFLIIILVGCVALYLFWDDIVARKSKPVATPTKTTPVVAPELLQKIDAPLLREYHVESIKL